MPPHCRFRRLPTPYLFAFTILVTTNAAAGLTVNRTIDDQLGDAVTGLKPQYSGEWQQGQSCNKCLIHLDPSHTHNGTWHDATSTPGSTPPTITMHFSGTAVYVYNVLVNRGTPDVQISTNITFELDGDLAGEFAHQPTSSTEFDYNHLVFASNSLKNTDHVLVIQPAENQTSLILFDYAMYTFTDDPAPPTLSLSSVPIAIPVRTSISASSQSSSLSPTQTSGNVSGACVFSGRYSIDEDNICRTTRLPLSLGLSLSLSLSLSSRAQLPPRAPNPPRHCLLLNRSLKPLNPPRELQ